ncbi:hypothetical protein [Litoreibacter roseus]|uniref:hypothetical protein n=1 Tax=Litoreibacter roseus TaxID=2601869 RepID=UPI0013571CC0|nr:hypothetical protein [Litoreibacter roseus]
MTQLDFEVSFVRDCEFIHPPVLLMQRMAGKRGAIAETVVVVGRQLWAVLTRSE